MNDLGKLLVIAGLLLAATGALLWSGFGRNSLGRLPGDIHYSKGDFSFHFPIVTCLMLSAALTILLWLFKKWNGFSSPQCHWANTILGLKFNRFNALN